MGCVLDGEENSAPILGKKEIQAREADRPVRLIYVEDWQANVYIRVLDAGEYDKLSALKDKAYANPGSVDDLRVRAVTYFLSDENGHRLYSDKEMATVAQFKTTAIEEIFNAGLDFISAEEDEIGNLEKN